MTIYDIIVLFTLLGIAYLIWHHNSMSIIARRATLQHCEKAGVVLLDQNILLQRIRIKPSPHSLLAVERQYRFEFSSVGDFRYQGVTRLMGSRVKEITLEPYKTNTH